jgi:hypothetical protein
MARSGHGAERAWKDARYATDVYLPSFCKEVRLPALLKEECDPPSGASATASIFRFHLLVGPGALVSFLA